MTRLSSAVVVLILQTTGYHLVACKKLDYFVIGGSKWKTSQLQSASLLHLARVCLLGLLFEYFGVRRGSSNLKIRCAKLTYLIPLYSTETSDHK